jgi:hypothetical protein
VKLCALALDYDGASALNDPTSIPRNHPACRISPEAATERRADQAAVTWGVTSCVLQIACNVSTIC